MRPAERLDEVNELQKVQDEADNRMLLHAKHAAADYDSIIIVADNTDVFMLSNGCSSSRARIRNLMPRKCVQLLHKEHVLFCWECKHLHGEYFLRITA